MSELRTVDSVAVGIHKDAEGKPLFCINFNGEWLNVGKADDVMAFIKEHRIHVVACAARELAEAV